MHRLRRGKASRSAPLPGTPSVEGMKLAGNPLRNPREFAATAWENDDFVERNPAPDHPFQGVLRDVLGVMADRFSVKA